MDAQGRDQPRSASDRLSGLSADRRRLYEKLLEARKGGRLAAPAAGPIPRRPREDRARLSFAQRRVWILEQLEPGTAAYCESALVSFHEPVDPGLVERALDEIVRRHEIFRTTFADSGEGPVQRVAPSLKVDLDVVDLTQIPPSRREPELRRLAGREAGRPFDLAAGPLLRPTLYRLGPEGDRLLLALHHIVCDGWSIGVLIWELTTIYKAFREGKGSPLPPLGVQYADYAEWQLDRYDESRIAEGLTFWTRQLEGVPPLELPTTFPRGVIRHYEGGRVGFALPPEIVGAIRSIAEARSFTPFVVLLGAFAAVLGRYARQNDFAVGIPVSGRSRVELEGLVGFFVNTLAVRVDLKGGPTFLAFLERVHESVLRALAHQDVPFESVIEAAKPARDPSRNPLFQVTFQLFTPPAAPSIDPGSVPTVTWVDPGSSKFDLRMDVHALPSGWSGYVEYSSRLFDQSFVERLIGHYLTFLGAALANPEAELWALPLLTSRERERQLVEWNRTARPFPEEATLPDLFRAQVGRTPEATAYIDDEGTLSYRELDRESDRVARRLEALGVGPGRAVGLCLPPSRRMIIAMMGVLKSGGTYVPLDPSYPPPRLAFMAEDSGAAALVCGREANGLAFPGSLPRLDLDDASAGDVDYHDGRPDVLRSASDVAVIFYTSGSTGRPKGVEVTHRGIARLVCRPDYLELGPGDRVAQAATPSFDAATFEIWGPLLNGGTIVRIDREDLLDPPALASRLRSERIDVLFLTTDLFHRLAAERPDAFGGLRVLLFGGSIADPRRVRAVLEAGAPESLLHVYGPTECTTFATWHRVVVVPPDTASIPIGRPIANTECYVLDDRLEPVPVGVPGEIYLGGPALARGYRNLPEATAHAFPPHPFRSEPGARLYKTGDLARYDAEGVIHFLGRIDDQVKLRGFRIEPGEVEAVLRGHPGVLEAVVVAREDAPSERRLVAYTVPRADPLPEEDLRGYLRDRVPDFLIPAAFLTVAALPLTENGKVDRAALPSPDPGRRAASPGFEGPTNPTEGILTGILAGLLGMDRVGIRDNFFELGGDSILAIQFLSRAREAGLEITARQFFQNQTIAELARVATPRVATNPDAGPVVGVAPLTPIQRWFVDQDLANPHHFNQAVLLECDDPLDPSAIAGALRALSFAHDALRTRLRQSEGRWHQAYDPPDDSVPFEYRGVEGLDEAEVATAIEAHAREVQGSLDLIDGPIFRVVLYDLGPGRPSRLLWVIHHIAVDGVSWRILLEDFWVAYAQAGQGLPPRLPARTSSVKAWAERLAEHASSDAIGREAEFWLELLGTPAPALPRDLKGGDNQAGLAADLELELAPDETRELLQVVPKAFRADILAVLLAGLARTLEGWTGRPVHLIDLERHGREDVFEDVDLSRTVGWFTAIHPLALRSGGDQDPRNTVLAVKEQLARVPQNGLGYGVLRWLSADVALARRLADLDAAEVSFNYLGQFGQADGDSRGIRLARERVGQLRSPQQRRPYALEWNAVVRDGAFRTILTYGTEMHERATVERLGSAFLAELKSMMAVAREAGPRAPTPADFTRARLTQANLEVLSAKLGRNARRSPR